MQKPVANQIKAAILFRNAETLENPSGVGVLRNRSFVQTPSPRASLCRIGPRRQGFASPLRALDRFGPIRKTALFYEGKGGGLWVAGPKGTFRPYQPL